MKNETNGTGRINGKIDPTLTELFETLYRPHKLAYSAESTIYQYRLNLRRFRDFLEREPLVTDLRDALVTECTGWIMAKQGLSAGSASKFRDNVCALWRFLARKGVIATWPDVDQVPEPVRIPRAWTRDELARLWAYLRLMPGELCGVPASDWFLSLHSVLWDSGERIGALLLTEWPQVDLAGGWIWVKAEARKGRLADKLYKLHPQTTEWLARIQSPARKLVWPWPYNREYLWTLYGGILARAGLPCDREHKFHCMRRSVGSHAAAAGGNAQQMLGHADGSTTREHYLDPRITRPPGPCDILFRPGE
jgi:integrase